MQIKRLEKPNEDKDASADANPQDTKTSNDSAQATDNSYLVSGIHQETHFQKYFNIYNLAKDPLIALSIIMLSSSPLTQILIPLLIFAGMAILSQRHKPLILKSENFNLVATFFMYILILLTYLGIHFLDPNFDPTKFNFWFGYLLIGFFAMIMLINI